jgi:hypothetical protein
LELAGNLLHKAKRVDNQLADVEEINDETAMQVLDDCLDLINYAAFIVRMVSGRVDR